MGGNFIASEINEVCKHLYRNFLSKLKFRFSFFYYVSAAEAICWVLLMFGITLLIHQQD